MSEVEPAQVLVDTEVISYVFRGDTRAERYRRHLRGRRLAASFMMVAELDRWVRERNWGAERRLALEAYLHHFTIYLVDRALCRTWAEISDDARRAGRPIQTADAWIAATARMHDLALVTHNASDYEGISGVTIITERV